MKDIVIYKPIISSQDIKLRKEAAEYLKKTYGLKDIKPHMLKFRIADENGELLKNPSWEIDLESYLNQKKLTILERIKSFFGFN